MTDDLNIYDPGIVSFLTAAWQFCQNIEKNDWQNPDTFIDIILKDLIKLYDCGLNLPSIDLTKWYEDTLELDEMVLNTAQHNIKANTPFQYYWTVLNPLEQEMPSTGTGDLIDDLVDIYKDIKLSLKYFDEVEGYQEFALWGFKVNFLNHWADHCVDAIQIVHTYLSNKD